MAKSITIRMKHLQWASPLFIHVFMVVSVALYTLFGAHVMRRLENAEIEKLNRANGYDARAKRASPPNQPGALVLSGPELNALAPGLRDCVQDALHDMLLLAGCDAAELHMLSITKLDDCYRYAEVQLPNRTKALPSTPTPVPAQDNDTHFVDIDGDDVFEDEPVGWSFHNAVVFAFTVITTIGYGNVAPVTTAGRTFCIIYGLIGVPLALLTIADIGMFLNKLVKRTVEIVVDIKEVADKYIHWRNKTARSTVSDDTVVTIDAAKPELPEEADELGAEEQRRTSESITLAVIFALYLVVGSLIISLYEPEMDFFTAIYFTFVSLTTIGLGDIVPKRYDFLFITFAYITVGLALTTMAIEIAAEFLKKLHYFGRKIEDVASVDIWFGGRKMKLKNLIRHLGDQLNIPVDELDKFNFDHFVDSAIKVKQGEIKTLRKSPVPVRFENVKHESDISDVDFVDDPLSFTSGEWRPAILGPL